jgi:hypothetical protein
MATTSTTFFNACCNVLRIDEKQLNGFVVGVYEISRQTWYLFQDATCCLCRCCWYNYYHIMTTSCGTSAVITDDDFGIIVEYLQEKDNLVP